MSFTYWTLEHDADGVTWVTLDRPEASANTLASFVMDELALVLDVLDEVRPRGVVFRSGKRAGFIAGADIEEFKGMDAATGRRLMQRGWDLYNRLAAVKYPTLALIRGHCMGGGLELALACRYRIVVDEAGTRLALPEVKLGIVPGWGGMLRLPQLIGPAAALDMMLTGRSVDARRAKKMGLADECVPPRVMTQAAKMLVVSGRLPHQPPLLQRLLNGPLRGIVAKKAKATVAQKVQTEQYPAPYALIEMWQNHGGNALAVPVGEPTSLDALISSPTTANLVRVFFLQERLKSFGKIEGLSFDAQHVHVVGAGVMGGDIAAWCALRGLRVTLQDRDIARLAPAMLRARKLFERNLREARLVRDAMDRLIPDPQGEGVAQADVVIEAIFENLEAKQTLLADLESRMRDDAILASNTSSLRLGDISLALRDPERLVGIHFFNPVAQMPLVEVVRSNITEPATADMAAVFVRKLDKLPLPVADAPGFLVNAVLAPYLEEAMRCVDEGIAPEVVDRAATDFGMPMGPIELADTVGLDIAAMVGKQLVSGPAGSQPGAAPPRRLGELLAAGNLGRKSGRGYYRYENGKPVKASAGAVPAGLTERLIQPMLAAAQAIVDAGTVMDADAADAGIIFGTGFAPFRGGPLHYAATRRPRAAAANMG
ncbi:MAG TPA: 3-hydroxyacyl-CoA dehydrogenase NAD-binding domain-containing protein [Rhodocyclaceae bacterium]|nr:3-hydroxyacyl-CoA dehydrogenase NAD-binding domain-containing protein [Rhodocyclaceae bacterium]